LVQSLPGKAIEGLDSHPWIHQDIVDFGWTNNGGLRGLCGSERGEQNDEEGEFTRGHGRVTIASKPEQD
jgi:hypothetical protein